MWSKLHYHDINWPISPVPDPNISLWISSAVSLGNFSAGTNIYHSLNPMELSKHFIILDQIHSLGLKWNFNHKHLCFQDVLDSLQAKLGLKAMSHFSLVVEHVKSLKRNKLTLLNPRDTLAKVRNINISNMSWPALIYEMRLETPICSLQCGQIWIEPSNICKSRLCHRDNKSTPLMMHQMHLWPMIVDSPRMILPILMS